MIIKRVTTKICMWMSGFYLFSTWMYLMEDMYKGFDNFENIVSRGVVSISFGLFAYIINNLNEVNEEEVA